MTPKRIKKKKKPVKKFTTPFGVNTEKLKGKEREQFIKQYAQTKPKK
jgi:hypothetical protein